MSDNSKEPKVIPAGSLNETEFDLQEYLDKDQLAYIRDNKALEKELHELEQKFLWNQKTLNE